MREIQCDPKRLCFVVCLRRIEKRLKLTYKKIYSKVFIGRFDFYPKFYFGPETLAISSWFNVVLTQWFNLGSSVGVGKKLLSISLLVRKVPFVVLNLILFNYFCIKICFKLLFSTFTICPIVSHIYMCARFCNFSLKIICKKRYFSRKPDFR